MTSVDGLAAVASSGFKLSLPHSTGMQSSLPILKKNYKFGKVLFWGKLMGKTADYLIAMGIEESWEAKKFFFWCAPRSRALLVVRSRAAAAFVCAARTASRGQRSRG